jgi:long-subunit fatty acid transport protein
VSRRPSIRFFAVLILLILPSVVLPSVAHAQGYFAGSKGARVAGRAGAFVAKADDLSAVELNPAGLARMPGWTFQLSNRFSYNSVSYQRDPTIDYAAPGDPVVSFAPVSNQTPGQLLDPLLGVAYGLEDWGFALAAYAPPGIARLSFPVDGGQRYMMVSRDAEILNYTASVAYKFKDLFGVGVTAQWIHVPKLEYSLVVDGFTGSGIRPVSSQFDMLSTVSGSDPFTFTAILGGWVRPWKFLEFGLSGHVVPARIQAASHLTIDPINFPNGTVNLTREDPVTEAQVPADDVDLDLPLPMIGRFGVRYIGETFDVELDATYQTWSRVQNFYLATHGLIGTLVDPNANETIPVTDVVIEKRWQDSFTLAVGTDVQVIEDTLTVRGGVGYESAVGNPPYAHVDFSSGQQLNGAVGGSVFVGQFEFGLAYGFRHQLPLYVNEVDGQVYQEKPAWMGVPPEQCMDPATCPPVVNAGSYAATSHFVSLDVIYRIP